MFWNEEPKAQRNDGKDNHRYSFKCENCDVRWLDKKFESKCWSCNTLKYSWGRDQHDGL